MIDLKELGKEHKLLIKQFSQNRKAISRALSMSMQEVMLSSTYSMVKSHARLLYFKDEITKAFEELNSTLSALQENEEKTIQAIKDQKEYRIKNGYTGNKLFSDLIKKYGNMHRAFTSLGLNTSIYGVLRGESTIGSKRVDFLSEVLGVDITKYLDEHGKIQQEDE